MSADISVEQLLSLVQNLKKNDESRSRWYVGPLITVIIAAAGVFVSWGMMVKTTEYLQNRLDKLETKTMQLELETVQLRIQQTKDSTTIESIRLDVSETKQDVKQLIQRRR